MHALYESDLIIFANFDSSFLGSLIVYHVAQHWHDRNMTFPFSITNSDFIYIPKYTELVSKYLWKPEIRKIKKLEVWEETHHCELVRVGTLSNDE